MLPSRAGAAGSRRSKSSRAAVSRCHPIVGLGLAESRRFGRLEVLWNYAVNAPTFPAFLHVRDVERAVGPVHNLNGAKAGIRGDHELRGRFVRRPDGGRV